MAIFQPVVGDFYEHFSNQGFFDSLVSTLELIGGATMLLNFVGLIGILQAMPSHTNRFLSVRTLFDRGSS